MLHLETIEPKTLELLRRLQSLPIFEHSRLVGGTALALQLGHRKSIDLDMFGTIDSGPEGILTVSVTGSTHFFKGNLPSAMSALFCYLISDVTLGTICSIWILYLSRSYNA